MKITRQQLLLDLHIAFAKAKQHKSKCSYVLFFEENLHKNLMELCNEIFEYRYKSEPSTCFIIGRPKKREIFAASFRDRIVHHLYFNYVHEMFERTFIYDCYSCIQGRGGLFGINRLKHHILSESDNYTKECYVAKIDIKGYFMHIDRNILYNIVMEQLTRFENVKIGEKYWKDTVDIDLLRYLSKEIILLNPLDNCIMKCTERDYKGLSDSKRLSKAPDGCGLPIGNLTSQLFSNVYLNVLDQYIKRELKCKHYGRYVDDAYIVSSDKECILNCIDNIRHFLKENLGLELQEGKTIIRNAKYGIEFLGAYIKPYRIYPSNQSLERMKKAMIIDKPTRQSYISRIGLLNHYDSFNVKYGLFF